MTRDVSWVLALRRYLCVVALASLAWESAQLPLYTLWKTGSAREMAFMVAHCTGGDVLIAGTTLIGSLLLIGMTGWPQAGFLPVAATTVISGLGTTAIIEHVSTARGFSTYSDLMPLLPGTNIGFSPLVQWIVIPTPAFAAARSALSKRSLDLPIMGSPTSRATPHQARSDQVVP
ncbi:hypothetical protein [Lichenicoccus roseus]|uniref:Uncharacterized protein n=1 Tax=Lichenicoccus roseus TaxID=2683649 RepID=A0A5R9J0D5_9PROT|nr:hypothetical protein [Lichenicoccus roseus]TLU71130.1 hypothetical protein FE263_18325 [Lichenicoccus roseus]